MIRRTEVRVSLITQKWLVKNVPYKIDKLTMTLAHNLHKINKIKILFHTIQTKASNPVGGVQATETGATLHSAVEGIHINQK